MIAARNLEITHHVDRNVESTKVLTENVDDNVKVIGHDVKLTKALTEDVSDNLKTTKGLTEDISDDIKATKDGMQCFCSSSYTH